jgi:exopolyphosphatase/guanosine-5'-triphosphate,3'-diphosphate pyrophosphatase
VLGEIDRHCEQITSIGFDRVIGTSGTILSLGNLAVTTLRGAPPDDLRNLRVSAKQIRRLRKSVSALDLESRLALPGLDPRRADLVVAGAILLDTILRRLGAADLTLCDLALREGLVLDYIRRNRRHIAQVDRIPDVRRRSVLELAERCNYYADHSQHVVRLALALFDQTRALHGLTDRDREWLEYAALMHDIGSLISFARHHRHSYYLIKNGDLRGFDPEEIEVIALVARYHRRGTPRKSHQEYADLPAPLRRTVRALASILRVAESLDRSHAQVVSGLEVHDRGTDLLIQLHTSSDAELELWATHRYLEPFEQLVRKPVHLEMVVAPPESQAPATQSRRTLPKATLSQATLSQATPSPATLSTASPSQPPLPHGDRAASTEGITRRGKTTVHRKRASRRSSRRPRPAR